MLRRFARQAGQDMVEFVLILPLLLAVTFAVVDFGVVIFSFGTLTNAVREGARVGIVRPYAQPPVNCDENCRDAKICAAVLGLAVGLDHSQLDQCGQYGPEVVISRNSLAGTVTVRVPRYTVRLPSGWLLAWARIPRTFDLKAEATMQME